MTKLKYTGVIKIIILEETFRWYLLHLNLCTYIVLFSTALLIDYFDQHHIP